MQAKTLEQEAHPALDKLTSKISTLNLERVRQIKSRLVAITGRVQKVVKFFVSTFILLVCGNKLNMNFDLVWKFKQV